MSKNKNNALYSVLIKVCIVIIITLLVLILSKSSIKIKNTIKKYFYQDINFSKYMNKYTKYFSEFIPFENFIKEQSVFNEKLEYKNLSKYYDGVSLEVTSNYLVPTIGSGLVVFIGEKENYGNVVIIQQVDGVDVWYGNISNIAVKLYDYVEKGSLLAEANNNLYLVLEKEGKYIDYETY